MSLDMDRLSRVMKQARVFLRHRAGSAHTIIKELVQVLDYLMGKACEESITEAYGTPEVADEVIASFEKEFGAALPFLPAMSGRLASEEEE